MKQKLIINLYVPINTILTCNDIWRQSLNLPKLTQNDYKIINELRKSSALPFIGGDIFNQKQMVLDSNLCMRKIKSLSFYQYLLDRLLNEARASAEIGIRNFIIENSDAPYFNKKQPIIYWLMRSLTSELKLICTDEFTIGLKLNGGIDDWAIDIACRNKINYIYVEKYSAELFLQRNQYKSNTLIYTKFNENDFSIKQQGFIIDEDTIDDKEKYFINLMGCRNYLFSLPFYPNDVKIPIVLDLWDQNKLKDYMNDVDYIICNSCFSKNGYADCGLDINRILSL